MTDARELLIVTVCLRQFGRAACPARWTPQSFKCRVVNKGASHDPSLPSPQRRPMSSDEAADNAEDPGHPSFIIMRPTETFDGQQRVMSRAAYDLQVLATAHSASCGHPGFVPDDYLEHLDGLAIEITITAAELCTVGMWERAGGGYRVLDWEAVEVCLDQVRQRSGEDEQALAWEREREALVQAQMAQAMVVTPPCAVCRTPSARVEPSPASGLPPRTPGGG